MRSILASRLLRRALLLLAFVHGSLLDLQAQELVTGTANYPTSGNPTSAIATSDGRYVFVSVMNVGSPNFTGSDQAAGARKDAVSGIQIFRCAGLSHARNVKLKSAGFIPTGSTGANGLVFSKGEHTLVVGVGDAGVAFLNVQDMLHGTAKPYFVAQGDGAGTFDVVASPDGQFVFSSNEYGIVRGQRGSIGIIETNADDSGRVTHPQTVGQIPVGDVVPSLALSPDGSRLYVATELIAAKEPPPIAGVANPVLTKSDCVQRVGTPPRHNGFITVIDATRAKQFGSDAILSRVAAGCSPVRLAEAADSSVLFVSARGDDAILAFAPRLLEADPEHALLRALPSGGTAPVGMRLFAQDRMLAVADSNRFEDSDGTLAVLDVRNLSASSNGVPLKTLRAGKFPRNIGISHDGKTLFLTNYTSRTLQVIRIVNR
jgi:DNA-binding beta-propeller fold protein YncE